MGRSRGGPRSTKARRRLRHRAHPPQCAGRQYSPNGELAASGS